MWTPTVIITKPACPYNEASSFTLHMQVEIGLTLGMIPKKTFGNLRGLGQIEAFCTCCHQIDAPEMNVSDLKTYNLESVSASCKWLYIIASIAAQPWLNPYCGIKQTRRRRWRDMWAECNTGPLFLQILGFHKHVVAQKAAYRGFKWDLADSDSTSLSLSRRRVTAEAIYSSQGGALAHNCSSKLELSFKCEAEHAGSSNWRHPTGIAVGLS